jgi:hypothetical protein
MVDENENARWSALGVSMISKIQAPTRARSRFKPDRVSDIKIEITQRQKVGYYFNLLLYRKLYAGTVEATLRTTFPRDFYSYAIARLF